MYLLMLMRGNFLSKFFLSIPRGIYSIKESDLENFSNFTNSLIRRSPFLAKSCRLFKTSNTLWRCDWGEGKFLLFWFLNSEAHLQSCQTHMLDLFYYRKKTPSLILAKVLSISLKSRKNRMMFEVLNLWKFMRL